ncbi:MAG: alpha-amylase family glycosyl hydrolase [Bacteroidota bacterium]|nr:alpha-amylase family glycosyl hydrolase [Bacteroidota bacterium]
MQTKKGHSILTLYKVPEKSSKTWTNIFHPVYEFHISKASRDKYQFDDTLFSFNGNVIFANFHAARVFTQKLNSKRKAEDSVRTGQVNAIGLIDEIYHHILRQYENQANPEAFSKAMNFLRINLGEDDLRKILVKFVETFPPVDIYKGTKHPIEYLNEFTEGKSNAEITLEEIMLLHFANFNPGATSFKELFDNSELSQKTAYNELLQYLDGFFLKEKPFGPDNQDLFNLLRTPIINNPDSLEEQLKFIMNRWSMIIDAKFLEKLLSGLDLIKEDYRLGAFGGGGAPTVVPKYKSALDDADYLMLGKSAYRYGKDSYLDYLETERFTPDIHWMPQVVLLAKNVFVWLDQLSKRYNRSITRLDQIPDEELDFFASSNFTGLWLIGLWERSRASQKIKQMTGNPEAVPSAYSIYDYVIAYELGGEEAFQNLNSRCRQRGIRLASDMVPNHMGIFSKWVIEHPDYFIQSSHSPFPNYTFTGPDLSDDPFVQLRIEDGYWSKTDAAVVFQRIDNHTGQIRYIYHGNDGTNMPWNDTAQLDMLKDYVREAVIQTIFHVARKTSIIRFDAAMTLAKRHFHRLWYPQPGTGGDIPSRSDYGLRKEDFDRLFPKEFWREVVDRINKEMPDTLLLAEAFWLMEGYFVRTLGMHRVYNSAFMHMMMKEENDKYRDVITNTLEFNPEILKRYVNFMSNPDEETAIRQFGTDDKYFGVATLLVTLPGLPMFGHGQIEGYSEKYGMEYKRAYYNEIPNEHLVERHKREIFPLMKKRYMFSQVNDFWFYDFKDNYGNTNENVFAYSNRYGNDKAIVVYNNKFDVAKGWINHSTGKAVSADNGEERGLAFSSIASALGINGGENFFYIYRDHITHLEYIRTGRELHDNGLYIELEAFKYHVFLDFREIYDTSGEYYNLWSYLNGNGIHNIERTRLELKLAPVHNAYLSLFDNQSIEILTDIYVKEKAKEKIAENLDLIVNKYSNLLNIIKTNINSSIETNSIINDFRGGVTALKGINDILSDDKFVIENEFITHDFRRNVLLSKESNYPRNLMIYLIWLSLNSIGKLKGNNNDLTTDSIRLSEELYLVRPIDQVLQRFGRGENDINQAIGLIRILLRYNPFNLAPIEEEQNENGSSKLKFPQSILTRKLTKTESSFIEKLISDVEIRQYIGTNYYQGEWYYSKENLEELSDWMFTIRLLNYLSTDGNASNNEKLLSFVKNAYHLNKFIKDVSSHSEYKLSILFENIFSESEKKFVKL